MYCPFCGALMAEGARACGACGTQLAPAATPPVAEIGLARIGDRFLAVVLDSLLFGAVFAAAGMAVARRFGGLTEQGFSFEGTPALYSIAITLLAALLYYWLCEGLFGATLGKGLLGISVRMEDGGPCGLGPSLTRNLFRLIDGIAVYLVGFFVAVLSKRRQRLGDHVARTIVVERKTGVLARSMLFTMWLLLLGGGFVGAWLLHRGAPAAGGLATAGRTAPEPPPVQFASADSPSIDLTTTGALKAVNFAFVLSEDGPSRPPGPYKPSEKVRFKYDIVGYSTDTEGRPKLQFDVAAFDTNGLLLSTPWKDEFTRRMEGGSPVHGTYGIGLPGSIPPGASKVVVKVRDELNNAELQLTAPFRVDTEPIAPATSLEVRDFELSTSETGPAVPVVELQDGGTVHMRCKVFGPQFRGDEADVRMAVKLFGPGGKVLFEKPDYGSIHDTYVYHPATFHVPVTGHLSLPGGSEKGTYKVVYTFSDTISGQSVVNEGRLVVK